MDLVNTDNWHFGNHFQMECAWFVFSVLLQAQLDKMKEEWKSSRKRQSRYAKVAGISDEIYFLPEYHGF